MRMLDVVLQPFSGNAPVGIVIAAVFLTASVAGGVAYLLVRQFRADAKSESGQENLPPERS